MTLSTSRLAFSDCYELLDKALEAKKGLRIKYGPEGTCDYMKQRFNQARTLDRENNLKVEPEGTELHGRSIYDGISIRKRQDDDGEWYVILLKLDALAKMYEVTELKEDDEILKPAPVPEKVQLELIPAPVDNKIRRV